MKDNRFYPLTIGDIKLETDSSICIRFLVPEELCSIFRFTAGQYLTLKHRIDKQLVRRSYSICSAPHHDNLQIAIKRIKGGLFSNYANDHLKVGDTIEVMPPQGKFTPTPISGVKNYICIAVGSGITPILSIIQTILHTNLQAQISLVYGNRRTSSMMFKETLSFIKNRYLTRFKWINIMSQEDQGCEILKGRIDKDKAVALHKHKLIDLFENDEMFICGPETMVAEVSCGFRSLGFDDTLIHYELFSSSISNSPISNSLRNSDKVIEKTQQRIEKYGAQKMSQVTLIADSRSVHFELASSAENILDAGLHQGMDLPYSCKAGVCSTCKAKLVRGEVDMDVYHGLEEHEMRAGYVLCCQAHPVSDEVVINFDQR